MIIKNTTKICLWVFAFVPLVVDHRVISSYVSGKNLLIESALVLASVLILINFFISKTFRNEITEKATKYIRHPLVISVFSFIFIFIISTTFAVDKYTAFWGDLSRAEGLAGTMFFFGFFVFSLLVFEKKDWLWFFKLSLFTSLILLSREFYEYFYLGISRPGSFIGNPTFLAGYLLFSIASGLIVYSSTIPFEIAKVCSAHLFRTGAIITIILSVAGIFIAQTRGTILGLGLGIIVALIYCAFKGGNINYKIFNLRKLSIGLLCLGIIFSGIFAITRKNEIWQMAPGLSRFAEVNFTQDSTASRIFIYKSALFSVDPVKNGWRKLLIGWGPDNFIIASSKHYNPENYKYEQKWPDRAHNKFLDVLVMNGIFGLLAYLAIWLLSFKYILKIRESSLISISTLSFGIAFLTNLMFVFDQISTSIPFFVMLAFITYLTAKTPPEEPKKPQISLETKEKGEILTGTFLVILTVFLAFVYIKNTLPGYIQMRNYSVLTKNINSTDFKKDIESVFFPFTTVQMEIRRIFLKRAAENFGSNNKFRSILFEEAVMRAEEYIKEKPLDFRFMLSLADVYSDRGYLLTSDVYLNKGETYYNKILDLAPNRPDVMRGLALNLFFQNRYLEALDFFEKSFDLSLFITTEDLPEFEGFYTSLIKYFYDKRDKANFIRVTDRLKENNYEDSISLDKIVNFLNTQGIWPKVNFD